MQLGATAYFEIVGAEKGERADFVADELWRVKGTDVQLTTFDKIIGAAPVERLVGLWREQEGAAARGTAAVVRPFGDNFVEQQTIMCGDILDISEVLQATLDLERTDSGIQ